MSDNPFPGARAYGASERHRFFGRDELSSRLEASVLAQRCLTVYGPAGAGTSSVLRASVMPGLVALHEAYVVDVGGWPAGEDPTSLLAKVVYGGLALSFSASDLPPAEQVIAAAQRAARRSPRLVVVWLDRVDELFEVSRDAASTDALFACLDRLVALPIRNVRVVLSLREASLGLFRERLREQPRLLDHSVRVAPLTVAEMSEIACRAAAAGEPPQTWPPEETLARMRQVRAPDQPETDEAEVIAADAQRACRALFEEREARP